MGDPGLFHSRWIASLGEDGPFLPPPVCQVTDLESTLLMADVIGEEIQAAIWAMARDKAPRHDGFPHSYSDDIRPLFVMRL